MFGNFMKNSNNSLMYRQMKRLMAIGAAAVMAATAAAAPGTETAKQDNTLSLKSPDNRLELCFYLTEKGEPFYSLSFNGQKVLDDSRMGFEIRHEGGVSDIQPFMAGWDIKESNTVLHPSQMREGFRIDSVVRTSVDYTWEPVWGEESSIRDRHNEMAVYLWQPLDKAMNTAKAGDAAATDGNGGKEGNGKDGQIAGENNAGDDEAEGRTVVIRFRLFDDGLGFRYEFPKQKNLGYFIVGNELTEFVLDEDLTTFWIAGDYDSNEFMYTTSPLSRIAALYPDFDRSGNACICPMPVPGVQTPVMMKRDSGGLYVNIHEAALVNFPAMQLEVHDATPVMGTQDTQEILGAQETQGTQASETQTTQGTQDKGSLGTDSAVERRTKFVAHLVPDALGNRGHVQTPQTTPWRTVIVADNAPAILESRLILNLNEPCAIEDTDWIKPQKFVGVWWQMFAPGRGTWSYTNEPNVQLGITDYTKTVPNGTHAANTENVKKYIDFAAANNIQGVLVEGWNQGWEDWFGQFKEFVFDFLTPYPDFDVVELREYAKSKGVQLVMHHETSGSTTNYERYLDRAYQFMKDNNYSVVKSGYVGPIIPRGSHHYDQSTVNHFLHCIKRAADYEIMIDAHEPVRPTGLHRTWPNYLAAESARGTEFESSDAVGNPPEHTTILPFTRLMGGPMDYTPGIFQQDMKYYDENAKGHIHTTLVKQLALYVVIYSPLQMVADLPENYERFPDAFTFIRNVPTDWDYTKVLEAEPGDYITTARKAKGEDRWYIGAITDENARTSVIDLSKLPLTKGKTYTATIYADGDDASWDLNPQSYKITETIVNSGSKLEIPLASSGGAAIEIK